MTMTEPIVMMELQAIVDGENITGIQLRQSLDSPMKK